MYRPLLVLQIRCDIDIHLTLQIKAAIASVALNMRGFPNERQLWKSS